MQKAFGRREPFRGKKDRAAGSLQHRSVSDHTVSHEESAWRKEVVHYFGQCRRGRRQQGLQRAVDHSIRRNVNPISAGVEKNAAGAKGIYIH